MQTDIAKEYGAVFADLKSRFDQHPSRHDGLICKHGVYMNSIVLKLQKASWTNDPIEQMRSKSGIFFSVWVNERTNDRPAEETWANYNIHALKLRQLEGYVITSRNFAEDFRSRFKPLQSAWPNVRVDYGPLTLMQGRIRVSVNTAVETIQPLMERFVELSAVIDNLLASRRKQALPG